MSDREDAILVIYETEPFVAPLITIIHPNETLFLAWEDYVAVIEQLLGERRELEAEGVTVVEEKAPSAEELLALKAWLEGVGTR